MSIEDLVELSRFYGSDGEYVLAGGGNSSWKDADTLYVKTSGSLLAQASAGSFVKMDRKALALIWEKSYPESSDLKSGDQGSADPYGEERESAVLADLMAARMQGEAQKRPSVETLLHDMMPFPFVLHLHPALLNGLTCSRRGEKAAAEIFGKDILWIPSANPGYVLSGLVKRSMDAYYRENRKQASVIFLQNHGVFAGAASAAGIKERYTGLMTKAGSLIKRKPDFSNEKFEPDAEGSEIMQTLCELAGAAAFMTSNEILNLVKSRDSFAPVSSAFTPDHIVYSGSEPLFTTEQTCEGIRGAWKEHTQKTGRKPKIAAVQGLGVFGAAATEKAACLALELFKDTVKVSVYSESFGGPLFMAADKIDFINNWEAERFRANVSAR